MTSSKLRPFLAALAGMLVFSAAACGGGGGDDGAGKGPRVTDPAKVATSTPISNAILYSIKQDGAVSASGSAASATVPVQTQTSGGGSGGTTSGPSNYTIVANDTCAAIADSHKITVDQLLASNRNINCNNLRIGDVIKIPSAATPQPTAKAGTPASGGNNNGGNGGAKSYTVVSGDTCQGIADANGVTLQALMSANPSIDANCRNIRVGQTLKIP